MLLSQPNVKPILRQKTARIGRKMGHFVLAEGNAVSGAELKQMLHA